MVNALPFLLVLRKDLEKVYARPKRVNSLSYRADARNAGADLQEAAHPVDRALS